MGSLLTTLDDQVPGRLATYVAADFEPGELADRARRCGCLVQVVIPARDEETTIGPIVETLRRRLVEEVPLVDDLVVVDDGSRDATALVAAAAGARVVEGPGLGKGEAMAAACAVLGERARRPGSLVVFLDGDVVGFRAEFVTGLVGPLLEDESLLLVKGAYRRPIASAPTGGGRVTELVAKPALSLLVPELAALSQPLAGETALRGSLLSELELAGGYAVEMAMLLDTYRRHGLPALAEVDLGERRHRNRSLEELVPEARAVLAAVLERSVPR